MLRNKTWYFLLYFISFCISTGIFHTVANAQESAAVQQNKIKLVMPVSSLPTPSVTARTVLVNPATNTIATPTPADKPTETPVMIEAKTTVAQPTPTMVPPTATPEPTEVPTPQPTIPVAVDLESLFDKYSAEYGADKELLKKIAKCESGFNPTSNNSGMYLGMYQFASSTWVANRNRMGLDSNPDLRTNAEEAIRTAAYMIGKGGKGHWPNCH
jgi:hypothetical protein